ncbi:MAG: menaquinone-dependent protoporphyrinogen IX dehydrogenase [Betaproteobacteria bacterium]|nr:menaquinone-dependent protoporphyrinogen IX dehydrogenase [Betaproteobacteria bacterium]
MGRTILIVYSTTDGQTRRICERLQRVAQEQGHRATLADLEAEPVPDPDSYGKIVIGARIRHGRHSPRVAEFVNRYRTVLESKPSGFFSVNIVARKPEKGRPETNPYVRKFLRQVSWRPTETAVFAGKLDYPKYDFWDRAIIRFIMWLTRGPTDPGTVVEFTDWQQVDAFGLAISRMQ